MSLQSPLQFIPFLSCREYHIKRYLKYGTGISYGFYVNFLRTFHNTSDIQIYPHELLKCTSMYSDC